MPPNTSAPNDVSADALAWIRCLLLFNCLTPQSVHPSWLNAGEAAFLASGMTAESGSAAATVSAWLRGKLVDPQSYDHAFEALEKRVFLIGGVSDFHTLATYLGASLVAPWLRHRVLRSDVVALRAALGDEPLESLLSAFGSGHDAGIDVTLDRVEIGAEAFHRTGAECLLLAAHSQGPAVADRTRLKLSRRSSDERIGNLTIRDSQGLARHLMMVALFFLPSWRWLFSDLRLPGR